MHHLPPGLTLRVAVPTPSPHRIMPSLPILRAIVLVALAAPGLLAAQERPDRWSGQVEFGFNGAAGNSSFSILRTGGRIKHLQTQTAEFEGSVLVRYGKNDERVIADDAKASLKMDLWPKDTWSPFVFADWSRDKVRRLDTRFSGGAGAKLTLWRGASGSASMSGAVLYDYQNFRAAPGQAPPPSESLARLSGRTKVEKKLSRSATFEHVAFLQPAWDDPGDYVLDMTHSLSTQVLGRLALSVEHQFLRDAVPPPGVKSTDHRFSVVLRLSF